MPDDDLPPFPSPPAGMPRLGHLPTIEVGLRYWGAVLARTRLGTPGRTTAEAMREVYAEARRALLSGELREDRGGGRSG